MPWKTVKSVLEEEWEDPVEELFEDFSHDAAAAASIGQVHRAVLPDGREVAVKVQYPGRGEGAARRHAERRDDHAAGEGAGARPRREGRGRGAQAARARGARLRVRGAEPAHVRARLPRPPVHLRARRGHAAVALARARLRVGRRARVRRASRQLPQDERDRFGEIVFRFCFGSIYHLQHFNADAHPGNYLLMDDGKVAFLDFGMTKQLDKEQIELEIAAIEAVLDDDPEELVQALHELGFLHKPKKMDAEKLMAHVKAVGGWYLEDGELTVDSEMVMRAIASVSDPRSEFFDLMRRENLPANELMGRRMESGVLAVLGQLNATRNWNAHRPRVVVRRRARDRARPRGVGLLRVARPAPRAQVQRRGASSPAPGLAPSPARPRSAAPARSARPGRCG